MRRTLANLFAVLCLLLFVAFTFMWVRSFAVADQLRHESASGRVGILSSRGSIGIYHYDWTRLTVTVTQTGWSYKTGGPIDIAAEEATRSTLHRGALGFWFFRDTQLATHTWPGWLLVLPYWFFVLLFSLIPLGRILRWRRRQIRKAAVE